MKNTLLHINASARNTGSLTRKMTEVLANKISKDLNLAIVNRDLNQTLPFVDEQWVSANFTAEEKRTAKQKDKLKLSNTLVKELQEARIIVIGSPLYNFSIAASLKAWIDMVARAGLTFKYTDSGPQGLLQDKKVYVAIASGGVEMGSEYDFSSNYLKHVLGFLGLNDVNMIDVNQYDVSTSSHHLEDQIRAIVA